MSRLIKDFFEVSDHQSLDQLIEQLCDIRDRLPEGADPQVRMRGNMFGQHLCIAYQRPLTAEEAECEARYDSCPVALRSVA